MQGAWAPDAIVFSLALRHLSVQELDNVMRSSRVLHWAATHALLSQHSGGESSDSSNTPQSRLPLYGEMRERVMEIKRRLDSSDLECSTWGAKGYREKESQRQVHVLPHLCTRVPKSANFCYGHDPSLDRLDTSPNPNPIPNPINPIPNLNARYVRQSSLHGWT